MTQEELGELLGVKKAAIQKYESGQVQLKQSTIKRLCEIFNVSPSYFIYDNLEDILRAEVHCIELVERTFGKEVVDLLEDFTTLNEVGKKKVLEYALDMSKCYGCYTSVTDEMNEV